MLEELLKLSPSMRLSRLGHPDTREALAKLGKDDGIAWLELHIESPIGPEWGVALYYLKPKWNHINRWIQLSKQHCLAAIDVLLIYSAIDREDDLPELPSGAEPKHIIDALDFALASYGNFRIKIRHVWSSPLRKKHVVNIPDALKKFAEILFGHDLTLLDNWQESMNFAFEPLEKPNFLWDSLLKFAETHKLVAVVDWREFAENIVSALRDLQPTQQRVVSWGQFETFEGETEELLKAIDSEVISQGQRLVSLDHGCDDYPLTFMPSQVISEIESLIASFNDPSMKVVVFQ